MLTNRKRLITFFAFTFIGGDDIMAPLFISHANSFDGEYSIIKRSPKKEFLEGFHYHDFYEIQIYHSQNPDEELGTNPFGRRYLHFEERRCLPDQYV